MASLPSAGRAWQSFGKGEVQRHLGIADIRLAETVGPQTPSADTGPVGNEEADDGRSPHWRRNLVAAWHCGKGELGVSIWALLLPSNTPKRRPHQTGVSICRSIIEHSASSAVSVCTLTLAHSRRPFRFGAGHARTAEAREGASAAATSESPSLSVARVRPPNASARSYATPASAVGRAAGTSASVQPALASVRAPPRALGCDGRF